MMLLLLSLACVSRESSSTEFGDHPSDSAAFAWSPGSDVPGWDDYACPVEESGANVIDLSFPSPYPARGVFSDDLAWAGPQTVTMVLRDCVSFECSSSSADLYSHPYMEIQLNTWDSDPVVTRGMGEFGPDYGGDRTISVTVGQTLFGMLSNTDGDITEANVSATACLSRVRPDNLVGVVEMRGNPVSFGLDSENYSEVVFRVPFDVTFADHTGYDNDDDAVEADAPDEFRYAYYDYYTNYEDAWPWDDISDGEIREELHSRYTPYNAP